MSMFEIHGGFTGLAASSRVRLARNLKDYNFSLKVHNPVANALLVQWNLQYFHKLILAYPLRYSNFVSVPIKHTAYD